MTRKKKATTDLERLRERKIAAEHDYLVCLRAIYAPRFACETDGYVFDEQHFAFGMLFGKDTPVKDARTSMDVYVWFFDNACGAKSMLQKCFVAPNVYAQRAAEREKEASARAVLNDMRANIDEMSRRYSDMSEVYFAALKEKDYGRSKSVSSALDALFEELQARRKEHDMYREQHGMRTDMSASIHRIFEKYK